MAKKPFRRNPFAFNIRGNLIAGLLALAPLIAVWLVFDFLLNVLFEAGEPLAEPLAKFVEVRMPNLAPFLVQPGVHWLIAVLAALAVLYAIGAATSRVIGKRLMDLFERIIVRIPLAETVYSATKKVVGVLQLHPEGASRVVLVEFPHPGLRAVGLVMRTFPDAVTGEDLAAVLVPTSPNPTTGYLEIVPVKRLIATDMKMDEAMAMIISGGATAPHRITLEPR